MQDVTNKSLLPKEAYTSYEWFSREQEFVFSKTWHFAGMIEDIQEESYRCLTVGADNLILIRYKNGTLAAFHNICLHRGTQLLEGEGKLEATITCPYHNWCYGSDGCLKGVPNKQLFPGEDLENQHLHRASVAVWNEMVFVHSDEHAPSIKEWFQGVEESKWPYEIKTLKEVDVSIYDIKANWKIFIENYMDGYHLWHLHAETLREYDHRNQQWRFEGPHWIFYQPLANGPDTKRSVSTLEAPIINGIDKEDYGAYVYLLFPNLGIAATEQFWSTVEIIPKAPDHTHLVIRTRMKYPMNIKCQPRQVYNGFEKPLSHEDLLNSGDFMLEDIMVCESVQKSAGSSRFGVNAYADYYEGSLPKFQELILNHMETSY